MFTPGVTSDCPTCPNSLVCASRDPKAPWCACVGCGVAIDLPASSSPCTYVQRIAEYRWEICACELPNFLDVWLKQKGDVDWRGLVEPALAVLEGRAVAHVHDSVYINIPRSFLNVAGHTSAALTKLLSFERSRPRSWWPQSPSDSYVFLCDACWYAELENFLMQDDDTLRALEESEEVRFRRTGIRGPSYMGSPQEVIDACQRLKRVAEAWERTKCKRGKALTLKCAWWRRYFTDKVDVAGAFAMLVVLLFGVFMFCLFVFWA